MNICIVGTGYVGLVAGAGFAESGNDVICVDIDKKKIEMLNRGEIPIYEPGLEDLIKRNKDDGRLRFTTDLPSAVRESLLCLIAVGTPPGEDGSADLNHVLEAARGIGRTMDGYKIIVDKSTVPVGTADKVRKAIRDELAARGVDYEFDVVSNPEFLKEGAAIEDFMKPDRVVIGADNGKAAGIMQELYSPFLRTNKPIVMMDVKSAEMTKYAANAMLATKISFINEIANLCEMVGADVSSVRKGIGADSRIGYEFLFPGVGYGGSCFPKDVKAIIKTGIDCGYEMKILKAVEEVNARQKEVLSDRILKYFQQSAGDNQQQTGKPLEGKTIGVWGLSFKPKTDDMREAPSITVINRLLEAGAKIKAHDPEAMNEARKYFGDNIEYVKDNYEALKEADALTIVTEWNEFRRPNFPKMKSLMKNPVIFDGRNLYEPREMREYGFTYYGIGRK